MSNTNPSMREYAALPPVPAFLLGCAVVFFFSFCCFAPGVSFAGAPGQAEVVKTAPDEERGSAVTDAAPSEPAVEDDGEASPDASTDADIQASLDTAMDLIQSAHEYWSEGDREKSLEALDQAYGLLAGVDPGANAKLIQQKEDLRYTISKRILEIYASRQTASPGTLNAIPLTLNKYVEREIDRFKNRDRNFFIEAYRRSGRFRGAILKALKEAGLPEELSWLPLVESGFHIRALTRSRALGLWQFIPSTGYKFGLSRNAWIDERMDPAKSTAAAIAYLKELHRIFGDWATALVAYNCGEGTVLTAISRQKINYLDNFWDLYERLPDETASYYPRFLAVLAIVKDPARYNMTLGAVDSPLDFEVVQVQKQLQLKTLAEKSGIPVQELAELNPELRLRVTPAMPYSMKVPVGSGAAVLAGVEALPAWSIPRKEYVFHRVRRGETLSLLALRYRTNIKAIRDTNRLHGRRLLRAGQTLKIPLHGT